MCGIAGKVYFNREEVNPNQLNLMSRQVKHRGPDDEGIFISENKQVGLVHRRLAINDLTSAGHQPMKYKNKYWMVFNGEMFNFLEEKMKLEKDGYKFNSRTDTEVILTLYEKYGKMCLDYIGGQFAFAIYDKEKQKIFLARDRFGKKPLKYFYDNSVFIFASELKAILTQREVKREPDWEAINQYLTFGYVPAPRTGFMNIRKLEPGHWMEIDLKTGKIQTQKYWNLNFNNKLELPEEEWGVRIRMALGEAVRQRMIADVPMGVLLSGGVDSSAVTATMARLSARPIKTFTISFKDKKYDETRYSENIVRMYNTDHEILNVESESIENLPEMVHMMEEPFANSSVIISYLVSKMAREQVKVVLNGDGGDEIFGGYDRYEKLTRDVLLENYNPWLPAMGIPLAKLINWPRAKTFLEGVREGWDKKYISYISIFNNPEKADVSLGKLAEQAANSDPRVVYLNKFSDGSATDLRDKALSADLQYYLADDLLTKMDLAGMSVALEARSPFLDYKLIELAAQIPFELKINKGEKKYILKKALEKIVPKENLYRKKMGFSVPLSEWFTGELNSYTRKVLLSRKALMKPYINQPMVESMLDKHNSKHDFGPKLWSLLALELWWEQYFNK